MGKTSLGHSPGHWIWLASWRLVYLITMYSTCFIFFFFVLYITIHELGWHLKALPCSGFVNTLAHISLVGQCTTLISLLSTLSLMKKNFALICLFSFYSSAILY
jgi:hypothetical protein